MRRPLRAIFAVLLSVAGIISASADDPVFLVADLNPELGQALGSLPAYLGSIGDYAVFAVETDDIGREVWSVDSAGAVTLLADLCPGMCFGYPRFEGLYQTEDRLYFTAFGPGAPAPVRQIWVTDGTVAGTRALVPSGVLPLPFAGPFETAGGQELMLFRAWSPDRGHGLWKTDGTQAGSRALGLNAVPGWPLAPYGAAQGFGRAVFGGVVAATGSEPWVTDGTDAGTRLLGDLNPGPSSSTPQHMTRISGGFLMFADDGTHGIEPWFTDGTPAGTRLVKDSNPGPGGMKVWLPIAVAGDAAYFVASLDHDPENRQLWRSDGTADGTAALTAFPSGFGFPVDNNTYFHRIIALGDAVLFTADDGETGLDLWRADAMGWTPLDLCPGSCGSGAGGFRRVGDTVIFGADDGETGYELWTTDGSQAGTRRISDLCPGPCASMVHSASFGGDRLFFHLGDRGTADDELWVTDGSEAGTVRLLGPGEPVLFEAGDTIPWGGQFAGFAGPLYAFGAWDEEHGAELWASDGTPEETGLLADLLPRSSPGADSDPHRLTALGDELFFVADDGARGPEPWMTDGTPAGTRLLDEIVPGVGFSSADVGRALGVEDRVYFVIHDRDEPSTALWVTDGTTVGTTRLLEWEPPFATSGVVLSVLNGVLLMRGAGGLWTSDGTSEGTVLLRPLLSWSSSAVLGDELFFAAAEVDDPFELELWATDGTAEGTRLIRDLDPFAGSAPSRFLVAGGQLYFSAYDTNAGHQLWISDGTANGTRPVPTAGLLDDSDPLVPLAEVGGRLVFVGRDFDDGGIWVTDGSAAGTGRLLDHRISTQGSLPSTWLARVGERLYLWLANTSERLFSTDGTPEGTRADPDLLPAQERITGIASLGDRLLISTFVVGRTFPHALWSSVGTAAGTRQLAGGIGVDLSGLTGAGDLAFAPGSHPVAGRELVAINPGALEVGPCAADAETLCLDGDRFSVTVRWRDHRSGDEGVGKAVPLEGSSRTGLFWFFNADNVELVVKLLDGGPVNGFWWAFYGALSDVEYWIEVVDTATGRIREYHNPPAELCGRGDTTAFPAASLASLAPVASPQATPLSTEVAVSNEATASACGGGPGDLCLLGGRFRVEVTWHDPRSGDRGVGTGLTQPGIPGSDQSGLFWFFEQQNVELVVKVLDGRPVNGRFWVFYGALSDVEYTIRVTDTVTDEVATYTNPPGEICGRGDTTAF